MWLSYSSLPAFTDHKDVVATTDLYPKATADLEKNALVKRTESLEKDVAATNEAATKANSTSVASWRQREEERHPVALLKGMNV